MGLVVLVLELVSCNVHTILCTVSNGFRSKALELHIAIHKQIYHWAHTVQISDSSSNFYYDNSLLLDTHISNISIYHFVISP
jgi:hypothetical protein